MPMPNLSDRLKSLGVTVGVKNTQSGDRAKYPIETVVEGTIRDTPYGQTFVVVTNYALDYQHGDFPITFDMPMEMMAAWGKDKKIFDCPPEKYAFIDTETTGLAGGSGTYAFLVGVGKYTVDSFQLVQLFMRDPGEELAQLAVLDELLADCKIVVTFNGKSFDIPLLNTRYITNGWEAPFKDFAHLDLLHLARRIWRQRLPSRTLGYLEEQVLGQQRTEKDTPGWMIPQMYFDYLQSGDARPLRGVLYHNAMDVLAMAGLNRYMAKLIENPLDGMIEHGVDLAAIGRLYEDLGFWDKAVQIFEKALGQDLPPEAALQTIKRLSYLQKRRGEYSMALSLWMQAAADRQLYAHEELAKYFEHNTKDLHKAKRWTEAALVILQRAPIYEKAIWEYDLLYRLKRLEKKLARS